MAYGSGMCSCVLLPWAPWDHSRHPESSRESSLCNHETLTLAFSTKVCFLARRAKEGKLVQLEDHTALGCFQVRQNSSHLDLSNTPSAKFSR